MGARNAATALVTFAYDDAVGAIFIRLRLMNGDRLSAAQWRNERLVKATHIAALFECVYDASCLRSAGSGGITSSLTRSIFFSSFYLSRAIEICNG